LSSAPLAQGDVAAAHRDVAVLVRLEELLVPVGPQPQGVDVRQALPELLARHSLERLRHRGVDDFLSPRRATFAHIMSLRMLVLVAVARVRLPGENLIRLMAPSSL